MSANEEMDPFFDPAYGSDSQWVVNTNVHDFERSYFQWDGPHEGVTSEKQAATGLSAFTVTPAFGNSWVNATTQWPIPTANTTTAQGRLGKHAEITKLGFAFMATLPKSSTSSEDITEVPDKIVARMQIIMVTSPIVLDGASATDITKLVYDDATEIGATWKFFGASMPAARQFRKLYDNKFELHKTSPRLESMTGIPESGSATVLGTTHTYAGDAKTFRWTMRDCSLMQKYSAVTPGNTGTVWNGLIIKWAFWMTCRKPISEGITIYPYFVTGFQDRTGINPKTSLYIDRLGRVEGRQGKGSGAHAKEIVASLRSRRPAKKIWLKDDNIY